MFFKRKTSLGLSEPFLQKTKESINFSQLESIKSPNTQIVPQESHNIIEIANSSGAFHRFLTRVEMLQSYHNQELYNQLKSYYDSFWVCQSEEGQSSDIDLISNLESKTPSEMLSSRHFESFKDLMDFCNLNKISMKRDKLYAILLKPYKHKKSRVFNYVLNRYVVTYIWQHDNCQKTFTKIWNMLDHVRVHQNIRVHHCEECNRDFIQKGNKKKHDEIYHSQASIEDRRIFKWRFWDKSYTERYNLDVSLNFMTFDYLKIIMLDF